MHVRLHLIGILLYIATARLLPLRVLGSVSWCKSRNPDQPHICWRPGYTHTFTVEIIEQQLPEAYQQAGAQYAIAKIVLWWISPEKGASYLPTSADICPRSLVFDAKDFTVVGGNVMSYNGLFQERAISLKLPSKAYDGYYTLGAFLKPVSGHAKSQFFPIDEFMLRITSSSLKRTELAPNIVTLSAEVVAESVSHHLQNRIFDMPMTGEELEPLNLEAISKAEQDHNVATAAIADTHNKLFDLAEKIWDTQFSQIDRSIPDPPSGSGIVKAMRFEEYASLYQGTNEFETECSICLEQFKKDDFVERGKCRHVFHGKCLGLDDSRLCPTCRNPFNYESSVPNRQQPRRESMGVERRANVQRRKIRLPFLCCCCIAEID